MLEYSKGISVYFFLFIILIGSVIAEKPLDAVTFKGNTEGLELKYPLFEYFKNDTTLFEFFVFNKSSGYPLNNNIDCYFYLYNKTGNIVLESTDSTPSTFGYSFEVHKNNFSYFGMYSYTALCNTSDIGGFVSAEFGVTDTGREDILVPVQDLEDELLIYFVFILALSLLILSFWKQDSTLASISGMILIILGVYITIAGFSTFTNILSNTVGIIFIAGGFYVLVRANIENF
jgi:hypothetical protein|tara:strand:- start:147 stop:842 length:696 start_codon:yes stop_codon:yes gene_type:complete